MNFENTTSRSASSRSSTSSDRVERDVSAGRAWPDRIRDSAATALSAAVDAFYPSRQPNAGLKKPASRHPSVRPRWKTNHARTGSGRSPASKLQRSVGFPLEDLVHIIWKRDTLSRIRDNKTRNVRRRRRPFDSHHPRWKTSAEPESDRGQTCQSVSAPAGRKDRAPWKRGVWTHIAECLTKYKATQEQHTSRTLTTPFPSGLPLEVPHARKTQSARRGLEAVAGQTEDPPPRVDDTAPWLPISTGGVPRCCRAHRKARQQQQSTSGIGIFFVPG